MMTQDLINISRDKTKNRTRWDFILMIFLLIAFVAICIISAEWKNSLKVNRITIHGSNILTAQNIFELSKVKLQTPIESIGIYEIRKRILQQPFIKSGLVTRHYPDAIDINITERIPIASLNNGNLNYIDTEQILLPSIESSSRLDLPIISGVDSINYYEIGEKIYNTEITTAINILQVAIAIDTMLYHSISEINMNKGKDIILYSSDVGVPIILGRGDFERKLLTLQTFWNNYVKPSNAKMLQYIDLRYNEQVVTKWRTEELQSKTIL